MDYHRNQVLAVRDDGQPFAQYLECAGGCGYVIGCGYAVEKISHESCARREEVSTASDTTETAVMEEVIWLSKKGEPDDRCQYLAVDWERTNDRYWIGKAFDNVGLMLDRHEYRQVPRPGWA